MKPFNKPLMVTESSMPDYEDYIRAVKNIFETKWLTNQGTFHNEFERTLKDFLHIDYLTLFCNGHLALDCAIKQLTPLYAEKDVPEHGEIITTPFTFVSTTHAISMNGFTPVFCDIKRSDYTIDEDKIESLITEKTVAIVPTHVYGFPCNVEKIERIAKKYNLTVIYDAAHAFAVEIDGIPIGHFGDLSMFSFHATKVFNTIEGGMLSYNDPILKRKLDLAKNFGILNEEEIASYGLNAKMNEFQAVMGLENLKYVKSNIKKRERATEIYYQKLSQIPGIVLAKLKKNIQYNYAYMPILVDETKFGLSRNELYDKLREYNIFPRKYFYPLISNIDVYKHLNAKVEIANYVAERILCLPLFGSIRIEDVEKVCEIVKGIRSKKNV